MTFLLVLRERMRILASAGLFVIPNPTRGNAEVWFQFGPNLQNLISHDSLQGFSYLNILVC